MNSLTTSSKRGPEALIVDKIRKMMAYKGWYIKVMHGNAYQSGFPDLFCTHTRYGIRLVEVKDPNRTGDVFTPAQHIEFPKISANGTGIWVLTGDSDGEYEKLFTAPNWYQYLQAFKL